MALITGDSGNNYLDGTTGDDTIHGNDGNDTLVGEGGADLLDGGNGDDRYWVKDAGDIVIENANSGYDAVWSEISYTLTANVEELDLLGTANIDGTGNSLDNWIFDNAGNNILSGLGGNDTLAALNGGTDTLIGGDGEDIYWINERQRRSSSKPTPAMPAAGTMSGARSATPCRPMSRNSISSAPPTSTPPATAASTTSTATPATTTSTAWPATTP